MTDETTQTKQRHPLTWLGWLLAAVFAVTAAALDHANQVVAVLGSPQSEHVVLTETRQPAHPVGQVSWLASRGALVFVAGGLRDLPSDKVYELWLIPARGKEMLCSDKSAFSSRWSY